MKGLDEKVPYEILRIIKDRSSGSKEIAFRLLGAVKGLEREELRLVFDAVVHYKPMMAVLRNVIREVIKGREPESIIDKLMRMDAEVANNFEKIISGGGVKIGTVSMSSTLFNVFKFVSGTGLIDRVYVSESRPGGEGVLFAKKLSDIGVRVTLVPDYVLPRLMEKLDLALIGCDAILSNYDVVNKVGSFVLALSSRYFGKKFIVLGDEYKFLEVDSLVFENLGNDLLLVDGVEDDMYFPLFEVVPKSFISYFVLNYGIVSP